MHDSHNRGRQAENGRREFLSLGDQIVFRGHLFDVAIKRIRYADGEEVEREIVEHHGGAVAIIAHDGACIWFVRQPREAIGEQDSLEIPAGRLDREGESPLQAAKRELAEEVGRGGRTWEPITSYFSSSGFSDEMVHLFLATDLYECAADSAEDERIEIVRWPLAKLGEAIESCRDAKTLIGLLWLQRRLVT